MERKELHSLFEQGKQWILEAGEQIRIDVEKPFEVNTKADRKDLVTEVDEKVEAFFAKRIRHTYPEHKVLGEEGLGDEIHSVDGVIWVIDPIDGTMNFVHQRRNFAISIGIYVDGEGLIGFIYDVMADVLYTAIKGEGAYKNGERLPMLGQNRKLEDSLLAMNAFWSMPNRRLDEAGVHELIRKVRGTRSYGSAALEFAFVAEGIIDAYITMRLSPWDIAGGIVIVNEVGGITTQVDGSPINILEKNTVITCNRAVHQDIVNHYIREK
ncbi:inositol monophosphatase family protein [Salirhabdus salicampi]|uniref:inositol monophosphatase family protein n=1 Tax=Salirhabdus salicampi TaxID=476102 RepID=UPI0020C3DFC4|nr:inositol monophosphatase family protein [Salirhabdus salicampi]MCP8616074.1 inositol monophosphatase family protein [Salirhabdus salicampi]